MLRAKGLTPFLKGCAARAKHVPYLAAGVDFPLADVGAFLVLHGPAAFKGVHVYLGQGLGVLVASRGNRGVAAGPPYLFLDAQLLRRVAAQVDAAEPEFVNSALHRHSQLSEQAVMDRADRGGRVLPGAQHFRRHGGQFGRGVVAAIAQGRLLHQVVVGPPLRLSRLILRVCGHFFGDRAGRGALDYARVQLRFHTRLELGGECLQFVVGNPAPERVFDRFLTICYCHGQPPNAQVLA